MNQDQFNQMASKIAELEDRIRTLEAQAKPYSVGSTETIKGLGEAIKAKYLGNARP